MQKILGIITALLIFTNLYSQDYIRKYSRSMGFLNYTSGAGLLNSGSNTITEIKIIDESENKKNLQLHIYKAKTNTENTVDVEVNAVLNKGKYHFTYYDTENNQIIGWFKEKKGLAEFNLFLKEVVTTSSKSKNLYDFDDQITILSETTNDQNFVTKALNSSTIKDLLKSQGTYWNIDESKRYFLVNYIGSINDLDLYFTRYFDENYRNDARIAVVKNNQYLGNYSGFYAVHMYIENDNLIFEDVDLAEGNKIDFSTDIPQVVTLCEQEIHFIK